MTAEAETGRKRLWARVDATAFGMIYGAVTVLALLMAMAAHPKGPLASAGVLFGSTLAISMAKAFADLMSTAIDTGARITRAGLWRAWLHARDTMAAANLPALFFVAAGLDLWSGDLALLLSQVYCTMLLMLVGARVGSRVDGTRLSALLGMLFAGGVGLALALLKYLIH